MPNISTGINLDSNFLNLKAIERKEVRPEVEKILVDNEKIMCAFKTIRDQVFCNGHILQFDFKSKVDIRMINSIISKYVV